MTSTRRKYILFGALVLLFLASALTFHIAYGSQESPPDKNTSSQSWSSDTQRTNYTTLPVSKNMFSTSSTSAKPTHSRTSGSTSTRTSSTVSTSVQAKTSHTTEKASIENHSVEETDSSFYSDELYCLAVTIYREAGNCSEETQMLVGSVVLNRRDSGMFPNTVRGVVTQPMQYGTMWRDGVSFPSSATQEDIAYAYSLAERLLEGERTCPDTVVFQAEFVQGSGVYRYTEGIYFCHY